VIRYESALDALVHCVARMWRNGVEMEWKEPFAGYSLPESMGALTEDAIKRLAKLEIGLRVVIALRIWI